MRKAPAVLTAALVFASLSFANVAFADDETETEQDSPSLIEPQPKPARHEGKLKELHEELEKKYGKEGKLRLPPMVIKPNKDFQRPDLSVIPAPDASATPEAGTSKSSIKSVTPAPTDSTNNSSGDDVTKSAGLGFVVVSPMQSLKVGTGATKGGTPINPESSSPIQIDNVSFTKQTPADTFIEASKVGLYFMGAGALVLGGVAVRRQIRRN